MVAMKLQANLNDKCFPQATFKSVESQRLVGNRPYLSCMLSQTSRLDARGSAARFSFYRIKRP